MFIHAEESQNNSINDGEVEVDVLI
jgi:hypothetical protein